MATAVITSSVVPHNFRATAISRQTPLQTPLENSLSNPIALRLNISVKVLLSEVTPVTLHLSQDSRVALLKLLDDFTDEDGESQSPQ
jgi:hypothetical protein